MEDREIYAGGTIKAASDGVIEGYLVPFGSPQERDLHLQYFDASTDFHLDDFPIENAPTLYHHGLDKTIGVRRIGTVKAVKVDDLGIWVQAQLDMRDEYERAIYNLIRENKMGWSSSALPASVLVEKNGHIKSWAIVEASVTPIPAMPIRTQIQSLKALLSELRGSDDSREAPDGGDKVIGTEQEDELMDMEQMKNMVRALIKEILPAMLDEAKAASEDGVSLVGDEPKITDEIVDETTAAYDEKEMKSVTAEQLEARVLESATRVVGEHIQKAFARQAAAKQAARAAVKNAAPGKSLADAVGGYTSKSAPRIEVGEELKYAHLSASDMALGVKMMMAHIDPMLRGRLKLGDILSDQFQRHMVHKMVKFAKSEPFGKDVQGNMALKAALPIKAEELDASDIAGQGLEWVGEYWDTEVWRRERFPRIYDRLVAKNMHVREIPRGAENAHFSTEGSDPVVYKAPQANSVDATGRPEVTAQLTPFGTGEVIVTPAELKVWTAYTQILGEDSVVNMAAQANYQINEALLETRDQLLINGDTATTVNTNINLIDGTPAVGLATPYYLASDGFRKLPLVTNTAGSYNALNGLSLETYRTIWQLMDGVVRQYRERLSFIIDPDTEIASMAIPEIQTDDVRRTAATITSGVITNLYGIDVMMSGFLPLTNTAGMVSATAGNNTRGTILLVYAPYWGFAYKRNISIETVRDIFSGTLNIVASARMGMVARGTNAATIAYNVGV